MAIRSNHYDAAFEGYLRDRRIPYVAVDERRRSLLAEASLKSMDFIVHSTAGDNLLIDVKGRRFPTAGNGGRWENWVTTDDVDSLLQWENIFGSGYRSIFVFAYDVESGFERDFVDLFPFREKRYAFFGVSACDYQAVMTARSARWETVSVARKPFRELRSPIGSFF